MPYRKFPFIPGEYYHLYNHGVNKQWIFFSEGNYRFFLSRLNQYFKPHYAKIAASCLMPTHYHLLILCEVEKFSEKVMQPFGISYTKSINQQECRAGPLFQGPFKPVHINKNEYLLRLSRYIHLNPVSAGLVDKAEKWKYSSYASFLKMNQNKLIHNEIIMDFFENPMDYKSFVEEGQQQIEEIKIFQID